MAQPDAAPSGYVTTSDPLPLTIAECDQALSALSGLLQAERTRRRTDSAAIAALQGRIDRALDRRSELGG